MSETAVAAQHPTETWAALVAATAIILSLITVLYNRLNNDIKAGEERDEKNRKEFHDRLDKCQAGCSTRSENDKKEATDRHYKYRKEVEDRLSSGQASFTAMGKELATIMERLAQIKTEDEFELAEIDRLECDIKDINKRLLIIETEHKNCQEIVKKIFV